MNLGIARNGRQRVVHHGWWQASGLPSDAEWPWHAELGTWMVSSVLDRWEQESTSPGRPGHADRLVGLPRPRPVPRRDARVGRFDVFVSAYAGRDGWWLEPVV